MQPRVSEKKNSSVILRQIVQKRAFTETTYLVKLTHQCLHQSVLLQFSTVVSVSFPCDQELFIISSLLTKYTMRHGVGMHMVFIFLPVSYGCPWDDMFQPLYRDVAGL